jgi:hypothetical protein
LNAAAKDETNTHVSVACCRLVHAADGVAANGVKRAKHSHHYRPAAIVLDIEGTVAPISFVADVMFPHARDNVRAYLEAHFNSAEARGDIDAIRKQVCAC